MVQSSYYYFTLFKSKSIKKDAVPQLHLKNNQCLLSWEKKSFIIKEIGKILCSLKK